MIDGEETRMDTKKTGIFGVAILAALATLGLLSLACPNRAAEGDSQKGPMKSGAQLWAENCTMCHEVKPRISFSQEKSDAIKRHTLPTSGFAARIATERITSVKIFAGVISIFLVSQLCSAAEPFGEFVELHSCDLYTGGCTASADSTLLGRQVFRAWSIARGAWNGQDLTHLKVDHSALEVVASRTSKIRDATLFWADHDRPNVFLASFGPNPNAGQLADSTCH